MELFLTSVAFIIGFALVIITIPSISKVARVRQLYDSSDERKIHTGFVTPLGGVAIFIGFTISSIVATAGQNFDALKYIFASVILMFFIGLKDDLLAISFRKKLIIQIVVAILLTILGNVRFTNLHGIFGVHVIGYFLSVGLSVFVIIVIVNAFNLIDGIDGLASGVSILATSTFGFWFFISGHIQFAILSFALVGSLAGFFLFNVFGKRYKLFMGDSGSLIIGLVISSLVVKFNEFNIDNAALYAVSAAPAVSFAVIIVPLIDTLRVMIIRIRNKKSPFEADNNHIHHRLLLLAPSHLTVTMVIVAANIFIIAFAYFINRLVLNINIQFFLIFLVGIISSQIPALIIKAKNL